MVAAPPHAHQVEEAPGEALPPSTHLGLRVLVVDDDPLISRVYSRSLQSWGCEVTLSTDGAEGLEQIHAREFDAVLTDIAMPRMNGLELLRALRTQAPKLPVILATGTPSLDSAVEAVALGAERYLRKPVELSDLHEALASVARAMRAGQEATSREGAAFESALASLWLAVQPIARSDGSGALGFEALMRLDDPILSNPGLMLAEAERLHRIVELGRYVRARAAELVERLPEGAVLFVNLHPEELFDPEIIAPGAPLSAVASRIVLEITERAPLNEVESARKRLGELRDMGFKIAIDDLGSGYSGLYSLVSLEPDVVKIDMSLIRDIQADVLKQQFVGFIASVFRAKGKNVVAEGVETVEERDMAITLGCDCLQGYLLGRPAREFAEPAPIPPVNK
jgi:EAL domain-containing protein (putative c-di-GMP-specific phosphodiesterase class I)